jgi:hypothetical protein
MSFPFFFFRYFHARVEVRVLVYVIPVCLCAKCFVCGCRCLNVFCYLKFKLCGFFHMCKFTDLSELCGRDVPRIDGPKCLHRTPLSIFCYLLLFVD